MPGLPFNRKRQYCHLSCQQIQYLNSDYRQRKCTSTDRSSINNPCNQEYETSSDCSLEERKRKHGRMLCDSEFNEDSDVSDVNVSSPVVMSKRGIDIKRESKIGITWCETDGSDDTDSESDESGYIEATTGTNSTEQRDNSDSEDTSDTMNNLSDELSDDKPTIGPIYHILRRNGRNYGLTSGDTKTIYTRSFSESLGRGGMSHDTDNDESSELEDTDNIRDFDSPRRSSIYSDELDDTELDGMSTGFDTGSDDDSEVSYSDASDSIQNDVHIDFESSVTNTVSSVYSGSDMSDDRESIGRSMSSDSDESDSDIDDDTSESIENDAHIASDRSMTVIGRRHEMIGQHNIMSDDEESDVNSVTFVSDDQSSDCDTINDDPSMSLSINVIDRRNELSGDEESDVRSMSLYSDESSDSDVSTHIDLHPSMSLSMTVIARRNEMSDDGGSMIIYSDESDIDDQSTNRDVTSTGFESSPPHSVSSIDGGYEHDWDTSDSNDAGIVNESTAQLVTSQPDNSSQETVTHTSSLVDNSTDALDGPSVSPLDYTVPSVDSESYQTVHSDHYGWSTDDEVSDFEEEHQAVHSSTSNTGPPIEDGNESENLWYTSDSNDGSVVNESNVALDIVAQVADEPAYVPLETFTDSESDYTSNESNDDDQTSGPDIATSNSVNYLDPVFVEENANSETECCICLTNKINVALNCGHTLCGPCSGVISKCHICRLDIESRLRIYI